MKDYRSVLEMAEDLKQWSTLTLLLYVGSPEKRAEALEVTFFRAADRCDDEAARSCYFILCKNFEDMSAISATQGRNGDERLTRSEAEAIVVNANQLCALKTMELYLRIVDFKRNEFGKYVQDQNGVASKKAVLLNTKRAMLEKIASQWKNTPSNSEAAGCFIFLWAAYELAGSVEEREVCEKVIMEAIKKTPFQGFSPVRLIGHRLLLDQPDIVFSQEHHHRKELGKKLLHAWVNNINPKEAADFIRAVQPLLDLPKDAFKEQRIDAAFEFLSRTAAETAKFHLAIEDFLSSLKSRDAVQVPGTPRISYHSLELAEVLIEVEINPGYYRATSKAIKEDGHKWFELARDYAAKWRGQYPQYKLNLRLVVRMQNNKTLIFEREQTIE